MEINHLCQELPQWNHKFEELLHLKFPLHKACRDGQHKELSRLLYDSDYDIYEEDPIYGWTPAHWAAYHGQFYLEGNDTLRKDQVWSEHFPNESSPQNPLVE
ncbi:Ankyrin repeat domain-containing protein 10 [Nymphon striatum]|nr:Ankyrin repeat domain-containing protein 10 [Nymphon striatum]